MTQQIDLLLADVKAAMRALAACPQGPLRAAIDHHLETGGSLVRARLALDASLALSVPTRDAIAVATACELLHNASLIHDDLQDQDPVRRGKPALWHKYGSDVAICAGDLLLSAAFAAIAGLGGQAAPLIMLLHTRIATTIHGQSEDLASVNHASLSLTTYEAIAVGKSGPLLSLPLELALHLSGAASRADVGVRAVNRLALGYQMLDDLADAEADAAAGEVNAVTIMTLSGAPDPRRAVRERVRAHLDHAAELAAGLPATLPQILRRYIDALLIRLGNEESQPA